MINIMLRPLPLLALLMFFLLLLLLFSAGFFCKDHGELWVQIQCWRDRDGFEVSGFNALLQMPKHKTYLTYRGT